MRRVLLALAIALAGGLFAASSAGAASSPGDPRWGEIAPTGAVQQLPREGSRLIVQPAGLSLVAPEELRSARFQVTDGCGQPVRLGRPVVRGHDANVGLPGQRAAVGGWHVDWTATTRGGTELSGRWAFSVVEGFGCGGTEAAAAGHSHQNELAAQLRAADDAGTKPVRHPVTAAVLAGVFALLLVAASIRLLRRDSRRGSGTGPATDVTALVLIQAVVIAVASAANGTTAPVRFALAAPTGLLVTVLALRAAGYFRSWPVRSLVAGLTAGAVTAAVTAVWAMGRSALFVVAWTRTFHGWTELIAAVAIAAAALCAGGWYAPSRPEPRSESPSESESLDESTPRVIDRLEFVLSPEV